MHAEFLVTPTGDHVDVNVFRVHSRLDLEKCRFAFFADISLSLVRGCREVPEKPKTMFDKLVKT